ncbi:MAG TPA: Na+/H+ antiporter NhaC family protein [Bacteroidota bacterium]|nr:Na+/H+ antiporter NhaC family protein [Bacteroidota bacterium]
MRSRFSFNTLLMVYAVVVLVALATWVVPGGEYRREVKDGRTLVVPGSFVYGQSQGQGLGAVLAAPLRGFADASTIIAFVFIIGGSFMVIQKTGAVTVALRTMALAFARKPHLQKYFIPVTMTMFALGGGLFGMCEETMPFVLIFIPLALSLGYDSLVGTAIPFLGAAAGFAGSVFNPFTVGIAQHIAELPVYSGYQYRMIIWVLSTVSMITFVMLYARGIRKQPTSSPVFDLDQQRRQSLKLDAQDATPFTLAHKLVLVSFAAAIVLLVYGVLEHGWYIAEIGALFLGLGLIAGPLGRLSLSDAAEAFKEGARDMVGVALIIGCARAILVVATDGKIIDVLLYSVASVITRFHPIVASQAMFVAQGVINFFVHSGSGQAALTMPVMAPLADVVGISRQTAVLAFQFGEGWINPVLPTSGVTMGVLGLAGIPWERWFRWMLPVQVYFFVLALILLVPPYVFHYH